MIEQEFRQFPLPPMSLSPLDRTFGHMPSCINILGLLVFDLLSVAYAAKFAVKS
jgi:hypothetical protein